MNPVRAQLAQAGIEHYSDFTVKELSYFKIGGKAALFIIPNSAKEAAEAVKICAAHGMPYMAVGCMSNMVIKDGRINRAFISVKNGFSHIEKKGALGITAGAGVTIEELMNFAAKNGLSGMEFMAGIPGSVGGAVFMNAGAFGESFDKVIKAVYIADKRGKIRKIENKKGVFSYRKSVFMKKQCVITGAELKLVKSTPAKVKNRVKHIIELRKQKHPQEPSAGSFFKNKFPEYTAGRVIEECGLKGKKIGGAAVSEKHANFIVNKGNATFNDVVKLAALVKKTVFKKKGIHLKEEVRYIR